MCSFCGKVSVHFLNVPRIASLRMVHGAYGPVVYGADLLFLKRMIAAFSDSYPTLYVFMEEPSTEPNLLHHGETTYRVV